MIFHQHARADWGDLTGTVTKVDYKAGMCKNIWWKPYGAEHETMFSLRNDGNWRAFPGPADGLPLKRKGM